MNTAGGHCDPSPSKVPYAWPAQFVAGLMLHFLPVTGATGETMVHHHFSFNTIKDSPDAEVLDYQYGSSGQYGTHANKEKVQLGHVFLQWNTAGLMPRGEFLYVKWRIKSSGEVYEDKADLRNRLPADIAKQRVHFVVRGQQLYIYLISPERKLPSEPAGPVRMYAGLKQVQIYPDQAK